MLSNLLSFLKTLKASTSSILVAVAALLVVGGVYYYTTTGADAAGDIAPAAEPQTAKLNIAPPFANERINVAPTIQVVQPDAPTVLTLKTGTTIDIPANVFVTMDNQPVTKPVEIRFREFHKAHEIIASGIPMRVYDAQGKEQWMQTAGMFDVQGFSDGQPVRIADGKTIAVNLASDMNGSCDFWYFNPEIGNWESQGAYEAQPTPRRDSLSPEKTADREAAASLPRPPAKPVLVDAEKPVLDFDINYDALPELKNVGGILWQYAGNDPAKDPANNRSTLQRSWDYVKVEPTEQPEVFQMTLTHGRDKLTLPVQACRSRANFEQAMTDYRDQYKKYEAKREKALEKVAFQEEQADFVRSFRVERFGIWNWDVIIDRSQEVPLVADFDFGSDVPAHLKKEITICLITGNGRSVITFPHQNWERFSFMPNLSNRIVALLPGNRAAVFSQEDFMREMKAMKQAKRTHYVFKMNVLPQTVSSIADLEKAAS